MDLLLAKGASSPSSPAFSSSSSDLLNLTAPPSQTPTGAAPHAATQLYHHPPSYPSYPHQHHPHPQQLQDDGLPPYAAGDLIAPPAPATAPTDAGVQHQHHASSRSSGGGGTSGMGHTPLTSPAPHSLMQLQAPPHHGQQHQQHQQYASDVPTAGAAAPMGGSGSSMMAMESLKTEGLLPSSAARTAVPQSSSPTATGVGAPTSGSNGPSTSPSSFQHPSLPAATTTSYHTLQQQPQQRQQLPFYSPQQQQQQQQQQAYGGASGVSRTGPASYPILESSASSAPAGRDPVQTLIDAYPNPHTENQKIIKMLELIVAHMQQQYSRFDSFMSTVEERLGGLEAALSQLALNDPEMAKRMEALAQREKMEQERERERAAARASFYPMASSPKAAVSSKSEIKKKKKKKTIVPEYEREIGRTTVPDFGHRSIPPVNDEVDEELARKLQAQFNAEAEIDALKRESLTLSDEEYAQKLQSLYLKRDAATGQPKRTPAAGSAAPGSTKKDEPKKTDVSKPSEEKSLWSRLFGVPKTESDEESEEEDSKSTKKTTEVTTIYPAGTTAARGPAVQAAPQSGPATTGTASQVMMPYYYPGMPQQPFVLPQGMPQYAPYPMALQPGTQYLYPAQPPTAQPQ